MSSSSLIDLENRFGARNYQPLDVVIEREPGSDLDFSKVGAEIQPHLRKIEI